MVISGFCAAAMETHLMKLLMNSSCADVSAGGTLELSSESYNRGQTIFTCYEVAYHFAAEPLLLLDISTSQ